MSVEALHGRPVSAKVARIRHESHGRVRWVGLRVYIVREDGHHDYCQHEHGHRSTDAARQCAQRMVNQINRALRVVEMEA